MSSPSSMSLGLRVRPRLKDTLGGTKRMKEAFRSVSTISLSLFFLIPLKCAVQYKDTFFHYTIRKDGGGDNYTHLTRRLLLQSVRT